MSCHGETRTPCWLKKMRKSVESGEPCVSKREKNGGEGGGCMQSTGLFGEECAMNDGFNVSVDLPFSGFRKL
jgi:hypothetical protein